jgi:SulP family sulfate permease
MANSHTDDISLLSFKKELQGYSWEIFRGDALAALSVALLTVPQAMAYALLAGLPLTAGLFAAIYSSIIAALFGASRHLVAGPSNAMAMLVQAGTATVLYTHYREVTGEARDLLALQILTQLALLVGVVQVLAAVCKLGRLTQFVSHAVIVGYITGTAIAVIINQLFPFLGLENTGASYSLYEKGVYLLTHASLVHWPTALIGGGSLFFLILLKKIDKRLPAPVLMLIVAAVAIHLLNLPYFSNIATESGNEYRWAHVLLVRDRGTLHELLPFFSFPPFDIHLLNSLLPFAVAIALVSILETSSVAKAIAVSSGQRLSINQEIFGVGLGNLLSSFITALPISGSATRSNLNYASGAVTRVAVLMNACFVGLILLCFSFLVLHIPLASLSALLLVISAGIVNPRQFRVCLKATSSDAFVLWTTIISCVFLSLDVTFVLVSSSAIVLSVV